MLLQLLLLHLHMPASLSLFDLSKTEEILPLLLFSAVLQHPPLLPEREYFLPLLH